MSTEPSRLTTGCAPAQVRPENETSETSSATATKTRTTDTNHGNRKLLYTFYEASLRELECDRRRDMMAFLEQKERSLAQWRRIETAWRNLKNGHEEMMQRLLEAYGDQAEIERYRATARENKERDERIERFRQRDYQHIVEHFDKIERDEREVYVKRRQAIEDMYFPRNRRIKAPEEQEEEEEDDDDEDKEDEDEEDEDEEEDGDTDESSEKANWSDDRDDEAETGSPSLRG